MQVSNWSKIFYNLERVAKNGSKVGSYESCGKKTIVELAQSNPLYEHGLREVIFGNSTINVTGTKGLRTFLKVDGKFPDFTRFWRTMNGTMVEYSGKNSSIKKVSFLEPQKHHGIKEISHGKKATVIDFYNKEGEFDSVVFENHQKTEMKEFFDKLRGKNVKEAPKTIEKQVETTNKTASKEIKPIQNTARQQKIDENIEYCIKRGTFTREYAQKYVEIFKKLEGLEGEQFATEAYELIAKSMGFKKYPKLRFAPLEAGTDAHCGGEGITLNSTISWTKGNYVSFIRHELEHFKQNVAIVEEFGINKFIKANESAIMHQYIEVPGYCYSRYGKVWEEMTPIEQYKAIISEMDHRFPDGINNAELRLLQRTAGKSEQVEDWHLPEFLQNSESTIKTESSIINNERRIANIELQIGVFTSKAKRYLSEQACYMSPGELPEATNAALLEGGRNTVEEVKQKAQKVFDSYNNCLLEMEARLEENKIFILWEIFANALKV